LALQEASQLLNGVFRFLSEVSGEMDFFSTLTFDVEDGSFWNSNVKHFFEAKSLRAELNLVVIPASFFSSFEIDGIGNERKWGC
jgi:hypothetical protein